MISRHLDEPSRDQDIEKPWDMDLDDDNWSYDGDPDTYRPGRKIMYAMMIAMGVIAAVVAASQFLT
jgi:hypothetical protein